MSRLMPVVLTAALFFAESASGVAITNGSLTGPITTFGVPSGWTILAFSPDTMDENNNGGSTSETFGSTPSGPSPDGGTWIGFARRPPIPFVAEPIEEFGQLVSGFSIGTQYTLSWYQGNFGIVTYESFTGANAIEVLVDASSVGSGSLLSLGPNWSSDSVVFTATSNSHQISFRLLNTTASYLSIDGISLQAVPEPTTALLLTSVLAGLGWVGRRRVRCLRSGDPPRPVIAGGSRM